MIKREDESEVFDSQSKLKLDKTHDILDRPEKFAQFFVKVSKEQTGIQDRINEMIRKAIKEEDSKKVITELIKSAQKGDWHAFARSIGGKIAFAVWSVALVVITILLQNYLKK